MGPLAGVAWLRGVREFSHEHLCRVFDLDPCFYRFDLPSSVRGVGSNFSGSRGTRIINGFVWYARYPEPVAKLTILQNERTALRDDDPLSARDFFDLSRT